MDKSLTRRDALKSLALAAGAVGMPALLAQRAHAADAPHVGPADPLAGPLGYVEDHTKVDKQKYTTYKDGQKCATCALVKGADGDKWRPCTLFAGKLVSAEGWCRSYSAKSA